MAGIELGGVNLDVSGLVAQLMQIENAPLEKLQTQETQYNAQVSEIGRLKSAMSDFESSMATLSSLSKFEKYSVTNSEADTDKSYSIKTDEDATAGQYSVEVLNLARGNKFGTASGSGFADLNTSQFSSTDNFVISDASGNADYTIDIAGKTLTEVRDAINAASVAGAADGKVGVSASIVAESSNQFHLVLTATKTGEENKIQISGSGASTLTELGLSETQTALDGQVRIDGTYTISSPTNEITDAISGVDISLLKPTSKDASGNIIASELKITRDNGAVAESIQEFVSSYNSLMSSIKIYETGALEGNSLLDSIKNSMRGVLNTNAGTGTFNYLSEIGVTSDSKTGDLSLNSSTLDKAIAEDYDSVATLFATEDTGVSARFSTIMEAYTKYDGLLASRETSLQSQLRTNSSAQERVEARLTLKEAAFKQQFSALDGLIGQMSATSSSLAGQLASLPGFGR